MFVGKFSFLIFGLAAIAYAEDSLDHLSVVQTCFAACSAPNEAACKRGCKFAYALTFARKDYPHNPSCDDGCKDAYTDQDENAACQAGCSHFKQGVVHVPLTGEPTSPLLNDPLKKRAEEMTERIRSVFRGMLANPAESPAVEDGSFFERIHKKMADMMDHMRSLFANSTPQQQADSEVDSGEPVVQTHVRILFLSKPNDDNTDGTDVSKFKESEPNFKSFVPSDVLAAGANKDAINVEKHAANHGVCHNLINNLRHVFANPFNLLLTFTLLALLVLFITQIALFVHRRPRRARGHEYTRLPTYTEAVQIKVPMADEVDLFKPVEKSKLQSDEAEV